MNAHRAVAMMNLFQSSLLIGTSNSSLVILQKNREILNIMESRYRYLLNSKLWIRKKKSSSSANVTDNTMVTILYIFFHCLKSNIVIALNMPYITSTDNPQCWVIEVAKSGKFRNCISCIQVSGLHNKSPLPLGTFLVRIHPLLHL